MGYCPFESRYNGLYRDTGQLGTAAGAPAVVPSCPVSRYGQATPTTRRGRTTIQATTRPTCARGVRHSLAKGSHDTKHCIVAEGRPLCRDTTQPRLRYGAAMRHDKALGAATRAATLAIGARSR